MKKLIFILIPLLLISCKGQIKEEQENRKAYISPYNKNPGYWSYKGKPVLLLGASDNDNLFQMDTLIRHLDSIHSCGANYVRNTMSSRDPGNIWPFGRTGNGKYDLDIWNNRYWNKFHLLLKEAYKRDIIIQIEIWDRFDYSRDPWQKNPFNPKNNVNYSVERCGMETEYPEHPFKDLQPFFHSIKKLSGYNKKLDIVRKYQERFVNKLLSYSLNYGNVLYCIDNETSTPPAWGQYWIKYIKDKANKKGKKVFITDMFDNCFRPRQCKECLMLFSSPGIYNYVDISQINSRNFDQQHWDTLRWIINYVKPFERPVNCTKVYGGNKSGWGSGTNDDGVERFCRDIMGGCAAARHHRPPHGNGLNNKSKASVMAFRKAEKMIKLWNTEPNMRFLSQRETDEAYLSTNLIDKYLIYFTKGGEVNLNIIHPEGDYFIQWISVATGQWDSKKAIKNQANINLTAPDTTGWICIVNKDFY